MGKVANRQAKAAVRQQFGALPYRETQHAGLEILLMTSRETHRWIIPKGWPMKGLKPAESAAREAYEEAGLRGAMGNRSIGSYLYEKRLAEKQTSVPCEVKVFPMRVRRQEAAWPEQSQRKTRWFSAAAGIEVISDEGMKAIIADFAEARQKIIDRGPKAKTKKRSR